MPDFSKVQEIARQSLMADFFAVRIDEEELYDTLRVMLTKIQLAKKVPALEKLKVIAAEAPDATTFIDAVKEKNLFTSMRDILTKIRVQ